MMDKERFSDSLRNLNNVNDIEKMYKYIIQKVLDQINSILYFGGHELVIINNQYIIKEINEKITIDVPSINVVDRDYIKELSKRAMKDIDDGNLDSAITKSRTILEETFCYAIELKGNEASDSGDIGKLYKQVKDLYNMHADQAYKYFRLPCKISSKFFYYYGRIYSFCVSKFKIVFLK